MVAIVDVEAGREERQRMVTLALEQGWIEKVYAWSEGKWNGQSVVVVLATHDASATGVFGDIVKSAVARLRHLRQTQRAQREAGLPPYVVFSVPVVELAQLVSEGMANDLLQTAAHEQYAVLCLNADKEVLVCGISPNEKEG